MYLKALATAEKPFAFPHTTLFPQISAVVHVIFCELHLLWCSRAFLFCSTAITAAPQVASGATEEWTRWSSLPLHLFSSWAIRSANASLQWYRVSGYSIPSLLSRLSNDGSFRGQRRRGLVIAWGYKVPSCNWWKRAVIIRVLGGGEKTCLVVVKHGFLLWKSSAVHIVTTLSCLNWRRHQGDLRTV